MQVMIIRDLKGSIIPYRLLSNKSKIDVVIMTLKKVNKNKQSQWKGTD